MLSSNTAELCRRHVKNFQLAHHQSCRELPMQRKWPWKFHCASASKAVGETDKQKWQPCCESVCLSFAHRSQPLPEGGFMMTALILSCESSSVFDDCPNTIRAQPQVIVPGPLENSYLRGLTRYCSMKAIFFSLLRSIKMIVCFSILCCAALFLHVSVHLPLWWADSPRPLFAVRWSDHGHLWVQTGYDHSLD